MVNYKHALCEGLVVLVLTGLVGAAPAQTNCNDTQYYDQQQNGSENYRIRVDNVIVAVAPAEALLMDFGDIDLSDKPIKPISIKPLSDFKPQESKPLLKLVADAVTSKNKSDLNESETPLSGNAQPTGEKQPNKEFESKNQEKSQRLKFRLVNMLMPLLKRTAITRQ